MEDFSTGFSNCPILWAFMLAFGCSQCFKKFSNVQVRFCKIKYPSSPTHTPLQTFIFKNSSIIHRLKQQGKECGGVLVLAKCRFIALYQQTSAKTTIILPCCCCREIFSDAGICHNVTRKAQKLAI